MGDINSYEKNKSINKQKQINTRINRQIRAHQVRLLSEDGQQLGIVNTLYAQKKANTLGLDLVEVSPQARPPVCKIMNYGKFKYQQKRKASLIKKKQTHSELKEIKFRPKTDIHDFNVKINKLKKFLNHGNKGKVTMIFRGRELVHTNIGKEILAKVAENLKYESIIESHAKMEGRQMVMILAPQKHTQNINNK